MEDTLFLVGVADFPMVNIFTYFIQQIGYEGGQLDDWTALKDYFLQAMKLNLFCKLMQKYNLTDFYFSQFLLILV